MVSGFLAGTIGIATLTAILLLYEPTREVIFYVARTITQYFQMFLIVAPKPQKILIYFILTTFVIGGAIAFFTNMLFFCNGATVYRPNTFIGGVSLQLAGIFPANETYGNLTQAQYSSIFVNESHVYFNPDEDKPEGIFPVVCRTGEPQITLLGLPLFDYRTWLLLLTIGGLGKFLIWYNKKN